MKKKISAPTAERRHTTRVECCYQVECQGSDGKFPASVINMGLGGMRLLMDHEVPPEAILSVQQTHQGWGALTVRVVWTRARTGGDNFECGVVYKDTLEQLEKSWVKSALQRLGFDSKALYERRRTLRAPTSTPGILNVASRDYSCTVADLGMGGALVELAQPIVGLQEGARVTLSTQVEEVEPLKARLVYIRSLPEGSQQCGLCFDPDKLTQAQARLVEGYLQAL